MVLSLVSTDSSRIMHLHQAPSTHRMNCLQDNKKEFLLGLLKINKNSGSEGDYAEIYNSFGG